MLLCRLLCWASFYIAQGRPRHPSGGHRGTAKGGRNTPPCCPAVPLALVLVLALTQCPGPPPPSSICSATVPPVANTVHASQRCKTTVQQGAEMQLQAQPRPAKPGVLDQGMDHGRQKGSRDPPDGPHLGTDWATVGPPGGHHGTKLDSMGQYFASSQIPS